MAFYSRIGNFTAVAWCSLGSALLGFFLLVTGAILTGVAYTEITPPDYDENYLRYKGSDIMRIVGQYFTFRVYWVIFLSLFRHNSLLNYYFACYPKGKLHPSSLFPCLSSSLCWFPKNPTEIWVPNS